MDLPALRPARAIWRLLLRGRDGQVTTRPGVAAPQRQLEELALRIAPDDPLFAYLQSAVGAVDVDKITLDSPALRTVKASAVKMMVPLVNQGELIAVLTLGARLSEQEYSRDDRALLHTLADQAAPALRVAQLVRQQQQATQERERIEQELRVARLIQQTLLPKAAPALPGWQVAAHYQPARAVGGDFYDFIALPEGHLGLVVGDVTDKGVPAALVMATTRSILRSVAARVAAPGQVLHQANELLCPDIPAHMFVTCLYAVLDPASGHLRFANAGHNLPYLRHEGGVHEPRARGMPLGLMPRREYEETQVVLAPGDSLLLYSDGIVEAHDAQREMFGFTRLRDLVVRGPSGGATWVDFLLDELAAFSGQNRQQEDDITLLTIERSQQRAAAMTSLSTSLQGAGTAHNHEEWTEISTFTVPSAPGNERLVIARVAAAIGALGLVPGRLEQIKTAVAEAATNAMEHGHHYRTDLPVAVQVVASPTTIAVRITDRGGNGPAAESDPPNLEAKLAGLQSARGWGLFLIKSMVDEMRVSGDAEVHTVELLWRREPGDGDDAGNTPPGSNS